MGRFFANELFQNVAHCGEKDSAGTSKTRTPQILADAAYVMLNQPSKEYTGHFAIDENILRYQGVSNFNPYKSDPACKDADLTMDFFLPENPFEGTPPPKQVLQAKL